jgi:hypothetical protein
MDIELPGLPGVWSDFQADKTVLTSVHFFCRDGGLCLPHEKKKHLFCSHFAFHLLLTIRDPKIQKQMKINLNWSGRRITSIFSSAFLRNVMQRDATGGKQQPCSWWKLAWTPKCIGF